MTSGTSFLERPVLHHSPGRRRDVAVVTFTADRLHLLCPDVQMLLVVEPDADLIGVGVQGKLGVPLVEAIELFFVAGLALRVA